MANRSSQKPRQTLASRFRFAEDSFHVEGGTLESRLRPATDIQTGEHLLIRLFPKTGTAIDEDLRRLVDSGLRRMRRVLSSRRARSVLVEVTEIVADEQELGIVMLDPGPPLRSSPRRTQARRQLCMTNGGRRQFWQNIYRVLEALTYCHDAGIVHGSINEYAIFSKDDQALSYRLGSYEACVLITGEHSFPPELASRTTKPISFRQDLADLAKVISSILGLGEREAPVLTSIELRMLNRMADPPHFQLYDSHIALNELAEVINDLERIGSSAEGELVLFPSRDVLRSDLPSLTSGAIQAERVDAVVQFVADDLFGPNTRAVIDEGGIVRLITDLAIYRVEIVDIRIGMIVRAAKRRPQDPIADAFDLKRRIYVAKNRGAADERVRRLGNGAMSWGGLRQTASATSTIDDPPPWHALILLEAFSLLKRQLRTFLVDVLKPPPGRASLVWLAHRSDVDADARRALLKLPPSGVAFRREMDNDEGHPDWTVSFTDSLGRPKERLPDLALEEIAEVGGRQAYGFRSSEPVVSDQTLFLRPRTDAGTEGAIRRRLQNIVAARTNVELLRALDDPSAVAMDDALRLVAAPGPPPEGLETSKKQAWEAIAAGRSINVIVGPPGVGKTYLVSQLIKSILVATPSARILVASQNHETLITIQHEINDVLIPLGKMVVRVEKSDVEASATSLRQSSREFLEAISRTDVVGPLSNPYREIREALRPTDEAEKVVAERVLRDTDNLLLRSSDVTLATTSSPFIEDLIADGEQFDWVFIEEAARANGSELIGALLLGNRRVMIGDHRQLSPFEAKERKKFFTAPLAEEFIKDGAERLSSIPDLPEEVEITFERLKADRQLFIDVLAAATRLEEPFFSIAEREKERGYENSVVSTLLEQNRMHPTICQVVSNTFYEGRLIPSDEVRKRKATVSCHADFPASPIVVLDLPPLSISKVRSFEKRNGKALSNPAEAEALVDALMKLLPSPILGDRLPSLVILSPYAGQVRLLERMLVSKIDSRGRLYGFVSPRSDGRYVYTSDSFQGGQADVVLASLVRNNVMVGKPALGFLSNSQRLNVILSRARHKLILATSLDFLSDVANGTDQDKSGGELAFVRTLVSELRMLAIQSRGGESQDGVTIQARDECGRIIR